VFGIFAELIVMAALLTGLALYFEIKIPYLSELLGQA